jgi:RNA polymerase sigma-70 factor (ECF subfamily)
LVISSSSIKHAGLEAVLIANRPELLRFFVSRTRSASEAEEVVQEIYLRLSRVADAPIADPLSYLYRVGLNIVIDRNRERQRRAKRDEAWSEATTNRIGDTVVDESPSPLEVLERRERVQKVAAAIAVLPPGAGRAFRMHKIDGLSHSEVAAELGISRSGVEKHISVAFRHLSKALKE